MAREGCPDPALPVHRALPQARPAETPGGRGHSAPALDPRAHLGVQSAPQALKARTRTPSRLSSGLGAVGQEGVDVQRTGEKDRE